MTGHLHLDPIGGIAGDMFAAALLDAFPHLQERVFADLAAVLPPGLKPRLASTKSHGIAAKHFGIEGTAEGAGRVAHYPDLEAIILGAPLSEGTAEIAAAILRQLAMAEATVHDVPLERVHFHEIADWDSLADVVAAASILAAMPGLSVSVGPLPLGSGLVQTEHGPLPVPAPATALLLKGFAFRTDHAGGERVTPTGAAILAHLAPGEVRSGRLVATGMGAGTRSLPGMANVLRVLSFASATPATGDTVAVLTFAVDDMTGEEIALAADRLRADPAVHDLSITPRLGKKGRPEHAFQLLVTPGEDRHVAERCLAETATIGLRVRLETRMTLPREGHTHVSGLRVKRVTRPDGTLTAKVESDDLCQIDTLAARRRAAGAVAASSLDEDEA